MKGYGEMRYETKITTLSNQTGSAGDEKSLQLTFLNNIYSIIYLYFSDDNGVFRITSISISDNILTVNIKCALNVGYSTDQITLIATVASY